ncbi:hypothetical protein ACFE04_015216 [Oxalis oulophora]
MKSLLLLLLISILTLILKTQSLSQNATVSCPLNFTLLTHFVSKAKGQLHDTKTQCQYIRHGLQLVESNYLQLSNSFLPPTNSAESCWDEYDSLINKVYNNFDIRTTCGFETEWMSKGCVNVSTKEQFETLVPDNVLDDVVTKCNQSLENNSPCGSCLSSLSNVQGYLPATSVGNLTDCAAYPEVYAAAFANQFGPTDEGTAQCLFSLNFGSSSSSNGKRRTIILVVVLVCCGFAMLVIGVVGWFCWRTREVRKKTIRLGSSEMGSRLDSIGESTTLIRFDIEEIKKATRNFSRENIIGRGGYGNVYKGILFDGTEVAMKRFKNCSVAGDVAFTHEVEVIASVRHINLVGLRGYCTATPQFEGHQRIIICDLMKNGSLYDHLFGNSGHGKLSWPIRQKIALGTARGLSYLHYGAQPAIIHRDIKASNILLDDQFEAKVADLGLAKFTPEEDGMPEMGLPEVMEKYVMIAILCSHTQLYARPTMDQVVKMLETEVSVPVIPDRPIPIVAGRDDIESSFGSGQFSSHSGYQSFIESDPASDSRQGRMSSVSDSKQERTSSVSDSKQERTSSVSDSKQERTSSVSDSKQVRRSSVSDSKQERTTSSSRVEYK